LKDVFPQTPFIGYFEFFYRMYGADVGFGPEDPVTADTAPRVRTKNLGNLLALDTVDFGQCPTQWQKSLYPKRYHPILHVMHEGVDAQVCTPDPKARLRLQEKNLELSAGDEIVTYVARNLEPYRGFPSFMRSLPEILQRRPKAQVLIVGGDGVSYGTPPPKGTTFKAQMLKELEGSLDLSRVHFLGKIPYPAFLVVLRVSRVHVYLTYPFVLSWSMLEAMSAGCLIVGSSTQPVKEVIRPGENGLLVNIFSTSEIAQRVVEALEDRSAHDAIRKAARQTVVERFDLKTICLPAHLNIISSLADQYRGVTAARAAGGRRVKRDS
jgi:glycosyltransferase involved in cell wall biosynthesis